MMQDERTLKQLGEIWGELHGGLWHTTHPDRLLGILEAGAIMPEPGIPNTERWKTSGGPDFYPYVRHIGGVSLFDFLDFDPTKYTESHPASSWHEFVPFRQTWGGAVWIELDREKVADRLISPHELVRRWETGGHHRHTIMPRIEAAYVGDLPCTAFKRVLFVHSTGSKFYAVDVVNFNQSAYGALLDEWRAATALGEESK